jgi:hypothetical protein
MQLKQTIDFVIPWVDGNDPEWQAEKAKYSPSKNSEACDKRYKDMNLNFLPYWFRGVEKFAPWVNKIHFITCGHLPKWLNSKHPKLNLVKHTDYMPQEYLPTFNSLAIIFNVHRIAGLAENFVLFNDDMYLLNKVNTGDFFVNNIPCDQALMRNMTPDDSHFGRILYNNMAVINKHFKKHDVIKKNFFKWFNLRNYGIRSCFINWQNYRQPKFSDMFNPHLSISYKKTEFEYVWQIENELLHQTCLHKFRDSEDVVDWLVRYFRVMKGEFKPYQIIGKHFNLNINTTTDFNLNINIITEVCNIIKGQKYKQICINDYVNDNASYEIVLKEIQNAFETILPKKSEFEV